MCRTPAELLERYWQETPRPRPVYVVRDGADGQIVDWNVSRRAAEQSPRSWKPVVERVTGPALL